MRIIQQQLTINSKAKGLSKKSLKLKISKQWCQNDVQKNFLNSMDFITYNKTCNNPFLFSNYVSLLCNGPHSTFTTTFVTALNKDIHIP